MKKNLVLFAVLFSGNFVSATLKEELSNPRTLVIVGLAAGTVWQARRARAAEANLSSLRNKVAEANNIDALKSSIEVRRTT